MGREQQSKSMSGRLLVVLLLVAVVAASIYAIFKISGSVDDTAENMAVAAGPTAGEPTPPRGGMPAYQLSPEDINSLQAAGLADPIDDLMADLEQQPALIPLDSLELTGIPAFLIDQSRVVSPTRVKSVWTADHDTGWMLLEYSVSEGKIAWSVLEYGLQNE